MFSNCRGPCKTCQIHYFGGCLAGHGDDDYIHADSAWIKQHTLPRTPEEEDEALSRLEHQLDELDSLQERIEAFLTGADE